MYLVQELFKQHEKHLGLALIVGANGMSQCINTPEVQRPGLSESSYAQEFFPAHILVIGKQEIEYLLELDNSTHLDLVLSKMTSAVILARGCRASKELVSIYNKNYISLCKSVFTATSLITCVTFFLFEALSSTIALRRTLADIFGVGILTQGVTSFRKGEANLGFIERGHRVISAAAVRIKKKEGIYFAIWGSELTRHLMEIRGIGIISEVYQSGAFKKIDVVVKLEERDAKYFYDRISFDDGFINVLEVMVPSRLFLVGPSLNVVFLLETIACNHHLKKTG